MLSQIIYEFEDAYQKGVVPRVQDFVPADAKDRTAMATELVRVDLEYRRKRDLPIRVDLYLNPFPELVGNADLLLEVIAAEYRQRQRHGEQPALDTYVRRFSNLAERLAARLSAPTAQSRDTGTPKPSSTAHLPTVPGYEVLSVLGEGGMGIVYQARHQQLDRIVALKMIKGGTLIGPEELQRFRTEAEAVARLQHPNVVQIHEVGDCGGLPYFTLEFCAGGSLARKLDGTPLAAREAAQLAATLARAMAAAHHKHIIHRDLKPHNVLLTEEGTPKITDFGLAKKLDTGEQQTQTGAIVGTPSYMAPEQARGELKAVGPLADVYALGAILYEMLTGRPPFKGATALDTVLQVLSEDPVPPRRLQPKVPRDLETICLKCLHKEPAKRYADAQAVAEDLQRFLAGVPILARPVGAVEHTWRWCQRHPARAALVLALTMLVLVGGGSAWLWEQQQTAARARQHQTDGEAKIVLVRGHHLLAEGWQANDPTKITEALAEGSRAAAVAHTGPASAEVQEQANTFLKKAKTQLERAKKNRVLLVALQDVTLPQETALYQSRQAGNSVPVARPSLDEQFAAAFRRWGLDIDNTTEAEAIARLEQEPEVVVQELVASLDIWMQERRRQQFPEAAWRRLYHLADRLDRNDRRRQLRALVVRGLPPRAESVAGLVGAWSSWPAWWELERGPSWRSLQTLQKQIDLVKEPPLTVVMLTTVQAELGEQSQAEQALRLARAARPDQLVLLHALAQRLSRQGPARLGELIECLGTARALRPQLGVALSMVLPKAGRVHEGVAIMQELVRQHPENPDYHFYLGYVLAEQQKLVESAVAYRQALHLKADFADAFYNLGVGLLQQKKLREAETAFRKALHVKAKQPNYYFGLGNVLQKQQKWTAAVTAYRQALQLGYDPVPVLNNLGNVLSYLKHWQEAVTTYRQALSLQPNVPELHNGLGNALRAQQKWDEATASFDRAIQLRPNFAEAYSNLSNVLSEQKKFVQAEEVCQKALELQPQLAEAHFNLGNALRGQGKRDQAMAAYQKAIDLKPTYADAFNNLGALLIELHKIDAGITALHKAIALDPENGQPYNNLGIGLFNQHKWAEAESAFRQAVQLHYLQSYLGLGMALAQQTKFSEALATLQKGHDLLPEEDPLRPFARQLQKQCQRQMQLDTKLQRVLQGTEKPTSGPEQVELARLCILKKLYTAAARLHRDGFVAEPKLTASPPTQIRYNGACAAALAGCGQGKDAAKLDDKERSAWRQQAHTWLQADLEWWTKTLDVNKDKVRALLQQHLRFWQADPSLAGVRNPKALAKLPAEERQEWQQLWTDVAALLERASPQNKQDSGEPSRKQG